MRCTFSQTIHVADFDLTWFSGSVYAYCRLERFSAENMLIRHQIKFISSCCFGVTHFTQIIKTSHASLKLIISSEWVSLLCLPQTCKSFQKKNMLIRCTICIFNRFLDSVLMQITFYPPGLKSRRGIMA